MDKVQPVSNITFAQNMTQEQKDRFMEMWKKGNPFNRGASSEQASDPQATVSSFPEYNETSTIRLTA